MIVAIHQPQYLPYLGFFHKLCSCDLFIALDDVQFQKNGLQNRNKIKTAQGWQWLTVPVLHRADQKILEVRINPKVNWRNKHLNALKTNYSKAPFFEEFWPALSEVYATNHEDLSGLNMDLTKLLLQFLGVDKKIVCSSSLNAEGERTQRLINLCREVGATTYLSGPGGKRYMDAEAFPAAGLKLEYQDFTFPEQYPQMFPQQGFVPYMSVLDTLFCCGAEQTLALIS